jgi:hypothetical protein
MKSAPRISLNKLVEYALANGPRRTRIIEDILRPKNYLLDTGYNDIERAFSMRLSSGGTNSANLLDLDLQFQLREARTDHEEGRILNALDMIERARTLDLSSFRDLKVEAVTSKMPKLEVSGLSVGVNPSNLVSCTQRGSKAKLVGMVKPYFSMTAPLTGNRSNEKAALHGVMLHWYAETFLQHLGDVVPSMCFSIDVFAHKTTSAPKAFKARRRHIEACALEICDRWSAIEARVTEDKGSITRRASR